MARLYPPEYAEACSQRQKKEAEEVSEVPYYPTIRLSRMHDCAIPPTAHSLTAPT